MPSFITTLRGRGGKQVTLKLRPKNCDFVLANTLCSSLLSGSAHAELLDYRAPLELTRNGTKRGHAARSSLAMASLTLRRSSNGSYVRRTVATFFAVDSSHLNVGLL